MACLRTYIYGGCVAVGGLLWTRGRDGVSRRVERKVALRPTQDGPLPTRGRHFLLPAPPPLHSSDSTYAGTVERLGAGLYSFSATGASGAHTAAATTLLVAATAAVPVVPRCCGGRGEYAVVAKGLRRQQQQRRWHSSGSGRSKGGEGGGGGGGASMLLRAYLTSAEHYQVIFARDAPYLRGGVCSAGYTSPPMLVSILGVALEVARRHEDCAAEADGIWACGRCGVHNGGGRASCLRCGGPVAAAAAASAAAARVARDARFLLLSGVPADAAATAVARMLRDATTPAGAAPVLPVGVRVARAAGWEERREGKGLFATVHARVEYATAAEARRALVRFRRVPRLLEGACGRRGTVSARLVRTRTASAHAGVAAAGGEVLERLRAGGLAEEEKVEGGENASLPRAASAAAAAAAAGDDDGSEQFEALAKRVERGATAADVESLRRFLVVSSAEGGGEAGPAFATAEQVLRQVEEASGVAAVEVLHRGGVAGGAASCVVRFGSAGDAKQALRALSGRGGRLTATLLPLLRSVTEAAAVEEADARRSRESMEEVAGILDGFGGGGGGASPAQKREAAAAAAAAAKPTHRLGFVAALTAEESAAMFRPGGEDACRAFFNDALRPHGVTAVDAQPVRHSRRLRPSFVLTFASPRAAAHARAVLCGDVGSEVSARQVRYLPDDDVGNATARRLAATARALTQPEGSPAGEEEAAAAPAAVPAEEEEEETGLLESCDVAVEVTSPVDQLRSQEALLAYVKEVLSAYAKQRGEAGARAVVGMEAEVVAAAAAAAATKEKKGEKASGPRTRTHTVLVTCARAEQTTPLLRFLRTAAVAASWDYVRSARRYSAAAEAAARGTRALAAAKDEAVRARTLWVDASTSPSRLPVAALRMVGAKGAGAGRFAALSSIRMATGGREPLGLSAVPARFPKAHPPGLLVRFATAEEKEAAELELSGEQQQQHRGRPTAAAASPPPPPPQQHRPAPAMDESDDVASAVRAVLEAVGAATVRERQPLRPPRGAATAVPRGAVTLRDAEDAVALVCHRAGAVRGAVAPVGPEAEAAAEREREAEHAAHPAYVEHLRRVSADPSVRLFVGKRALWERLLPEHEPGPCAVLRDHAAILARRGKQGYLRALHVTTLLTRSSLLWQDALCVSSIRYMLLPESAIAGVVRFAELAERKLALQGEDLSFPFYCALFRVLRSVSPTRWLHLYARFRELLSAACVVDRTRRAAGTDIAGYLYDGPFITKTLTSKAVGVGGGVRRRRLVCVTPDVSAAYAQLFSAAGRTHGERLRARGEVWTRFLPLLPSMLRRDFEALGLVVQEPHARRHFAALSDLGQFKRCVALVDWGGPGGGWRLASSEGRVPVSLAAATRSAGDLRELLRLLGEEQEGFAPSAVFYKSLGRAARLHWDPPASEAFLQQCAAREMECEAAGRKGGRAMPPEAPRTAAMSKTNWVPI